MLEELITLSRHSTLIFRKKLKIYATLAKPDCFFLFIIIHSKGREKVIKWTAGASDIK